MPAITGKQAVRPFGIRCHANVWQSGKVETSAVLKKAVRNENQSQIQLTTACHCWLAMLQSYPPRQIPTSMQCETPVFSYSDGEGSTAGVAICIYLLHQNPMVAFATVPPVVRRAWGVEINGRRNDIFEVEAVGPILVLWQISKKCWIHFIDNGAAQQAIVRGSSSVESGDIISAQTWCLASKLQCWLRIGRVCSKSILIDGVSRPWKNVEKAHWSSELLQDLSLLTKTYGA